MRQGSKITMDGFLLWRWSRPCLEYNESFSKRPRARGILDGAKRQGFQPVANG